MQQRKPLSEPGAQSMAPAASEPSQSVSASEPVSSAGWTNFADPSAAIPAGLGPDSLSQASADFGFGIGAPIDLPPGTDLGGVTILRVVGTGGMGRVYEAVQQSPQRSVAVKVMRDGIVTAAQMRRFEYEAQVLARLRHPHIAQIYALSTARVGPLPIPYFVMELVPDARPLHVFCAADSLSIRARVALMRKVAAAVAHGHQKGVIHRDLKPGNILVGGDGEPKVIDFGIARSTDGEAAVTALHLTDPGQVVGTLSYMSPEQLAGRGEDVDARSDVHALGLVLHELVTGELPYDLRGRSVLEAVRVVHDEEPDVRAPVAAAARRDPDVSADDARSLSVIVAKCLEKRPADRYATAAELAAELGRWLAGEPIVARPLSAGEQLLRLARRHRAAAAALFSALAALIAAVVGISFFAVRAEREGAAARAQLYRATVLLASASRDRGAEAEARRQLAMARGLVADAGTRRPLELACLAASLDDAVAVLTGHEGTVRALAWGPDGDRLVSAGEDGTLRVWEPAEAERRDAWRQATLAAVDTELWGVAISPDGDTVAVACADGAARMWDMRTGRELLRCEGHAGTVYGVAFSHDGQRLITVGRDGGPRVWDATTGEEVMRLTGHVGTVYSAACSRDGSVIATAGKDATVRLWDAETGHERATLRGHANHVFFVAFSWQGDLLASASEDATVRIWDVASGEERAVLQHPLKANAVAFTADDRVVTATNDAVLRIWDPATGLEVGRRLGHEGGVWGVACVGQGPWIASGGTDGIVRVSRHDYGSNPALRCGSSVRAVAHDPAGALVAIGTGSGVQVWDAACGHQVATLSHDGRQVNDVQFFPGGRLLAAACDGGVVEVWQCGAAGLSNRGEPRDHGEPVAEPLRFTAHSRRVYSVDIDTIGQRLATAGEDKTARIWQWGEEPQEIAAIKHEKRVLCGRFSPDGAILYTACEDRVARGWEIATGRERVRYEGHAAPVNWLALSPNAKRLATASSDGTVRLWDAASGVVQATLTGSPQQLWKVAFTPDGSRVIAVSADGGVYLWDAVSGEAVSVLRGHAGWAWGLSVGPAGQTLVSGGNDGMIRLWGLPAGQVQRP